MAICGLVVSASSCESESSVVCPSLFRVGKRKQSDDAKQGFTDKNLWFLTDSSN